MCCVSEYENAAMVTGVSLLWILKSKAREAQAPVVYSPSVQTVVQGTEAEPVPPEHHALDGAVTRCLVCRCFSTTHQGLDLNSRPGCKV